ncbi:MAG: hypothetical protein IKM39_00715 [Clostridia bacterium]|nr:hypothetical protein [Clostridia bacterium]
MSEQGMEKIVTEKKQLSEGDYKIKIHAVTVAQTVAFAFSIVVLILEIIFSKTLVIGFACLGMCFVITGVEKWLTYFSLKNKNDLLTALVDSSAFFACTLFVLLAVI